jgi:hypothetical protein
MTVLCRTSEPLREEILANADGESPIVTDEAMSCYIQEFDHLYNIGFFGKSIILFGEGRKGKQIPRRYSIGLIIYKCRANLPFSETKIYTMSGMTP